MSSGKVRITRSRSRGRKLTAKAVTAKAVKVADTTTVSAATGTADTVAAATSTDTIAATTNGQTKVTQYFRTVHRDLSKKKCKRLKELADDVVQVGHTKAIPFESPNKMARLKSPRTSTSAEEGNPESAELKWILHDTTTGSSKDEATGAGKGKKTVVGDNGDDDDDDDGGGGGSRSGTVPVRAGKNENEPAKQPDDDAIPVREGRNEDGLTRRPEPNLSEEKPEPSSSKKKPETPRTKGTSEIFPEAEHKKFSSYVKKSDGKVSGVSDKDRIIGPPEICDDLDNDLSSMPTSMKLFESIKKSTGVVGVVGTSNLIETLPLPAKYERLLRLFDYTEVVVSWLETQGKRITLNEVITNVQRGLKSNYGKQQFAQLLSVYPESYKVHCERRWMPIGGRNCKPNEFEYVIEPNLVDDLIIPEENVQKTPTPLSSPVKATFSSPAKNSLISLTRNPMTSPPKSLTRTGSKSPSRFPKSPLKSPTKSLLTGCPTKLEARRLLRKMEFKNRLRKLVNIQHSAFLKNEGIDISPDEQLPRYHPDFDLDTVQDIIPVQLPEIPKGDAGQPETMREYMKTVPDSSNTLPEKIKIRAKERERKRREMLRNPEMEQKKGRLERISRSLLQCICSYYNLKKVGSMKFTELLDKLAFGIGCISKVELQATLNLLCEICPTFFKVVEVRGEKYIQLKENNFTAIRDAVNAELAKCV